MVEAAHDIRTRISSLPVVLARYRNRERHSPSLQALNDDFEHTMDEALRIITRIKEKVGPVKLRLRRVDLVKLVRTALGGLLPGHQWELLYARETLDADADSGLLENALLELVQNSREMTLVQNDLRVRVSLEMVNRDITEWIRLLYKDNGPGVPENLKSRIFEPFYSRRPGPKTSTGLGLAYVQRVISAHGGVIHESGVPGSGAQFQLDFTRFADEEEDHVQVPDS
jgi:signal transduction histidine kinase